MILSGIRPKKYLGQNFLRSESVVKKITDSLQILNEQKIVEIGAGEGVLTEELLSRGFRVVAVEKDKELAAFLKERFRSTSKLTILRDDFLKLNLKDLAEGKERLHIVGNIPYNITSPILFKILEERSFVKDVILMIQKEVGERLISKPGNKKYGIPTVLFNQFADVEKLFLVGRHSFSPVPRVDSIVIKITFLDGTRFNLRDEDLFRNIVKKAFGQRRKMLKNSLQSFFLNSRFDEISVDVTKRPEQLTLEEFTTLANELNS